MTNAQVIQNSEEAKDEMIGRKFGALTVLRRYRNRRGIYVCICSDCGTTIAAYGSQLRAGMKSCGCRRGLTELEADE